MKLMQMMTSAQTLDSMPTDRPERMVVAGPVLVDLTISLTGAFAGRGEVGGQRVEDHGQADADRGQHGQPPVVRVVDGQDEGPEDRC